MTLSLSFILPTSVSPSAAAFDGKRLYAIDGLTPYVFAFDRNGVFLDRYRTLRPYENAKYDERNGRFCCLGGGRRGRIYAVNSRFEEVGSVVAEAQNASDARNILDAGYRFDGSGFDVTHPHSLRIYSTDGSYDRTVTRTPVGRTFLHWNDFGSHRALHYEENGRKYVTVDRIGGTLPDGAELKSFIPWGEELYGVFSFGYLYTYVVPVFTEGKLNTSIFGSFAFVADGISKK